MNAPQKRRAGGLIGAFLLLLTSLLQPGDARSNVPHLGYGFNVASWDISLMQEMGFNWMKVFNPPGDRLPLNILIRVDATASHLGNLSQFGDDVQNLAANHGPYVEAYEIGNEPNLDASYGWTTAPVAADYVTLLCEAYNRIKLADPTSIVVSAGLAPTGRVTGDWNGHAGHNGFYQDERAYLTEFIAAGGANCADAIGYHPYGFNADFDAPPDVADADPAQNCTNGFCFRGVEKIYEIMADNGVGDKKVWVTEYGWITQPPSHCLDDPGWQGRAWQIVSEARQASNLRGSFEYADANWPWMGTMIIFNLNFNNGWYPECEQMAFYAVEGRPAQGELTAMVKNPAVFEAALAATPASLTAVVVASDQPTDSNLSLTLENGGWLATTFTVTADEDAAVVPIVATPSGSLPAGSQTTITITIPGAVRAPGIYSGSLLVDAPGGAQGVPQTVPLTLVVFEPTDVTYMPGIAR